MRWKMWMAASAFVSVPDAVDFGVFFVLVALRGWCPSCNERCRLGATSRGQFIPFLRWKSNPSDVGGTPKTGAFLIDVLPREFVRRIRGGLGGLVAAFPADLRPLYR